MVENSGRESCAAIAAPPTWYDGELIFVAMLSAVAFAALEVSGERPGGFAWVCVDMGAS